MSDKENNVQTLSVSTYVSSISGRRVSLDVDIDYDLDIVTFAVRTFDVPTALMFISPTRAKCVFNAECMRLERLDLDEDEKKRSRLMRLCETFTRAPCAHGTRRRP